MYHIYTTKLGGGSHQDQADIQHEIFYTKKNGAPVKTDRCQPTWNVCDATMFEKAFHLKYKTRPFCNTAALDFLAKLIETNCEGIHLLVACNVYKDDSFTYILKLFCLYCNQIIPQCILEYTSGLQSRFF